MRTIESSLTLKRVEAVSIIPRHLIEALPSDAAGGLNCHQLAKATLTQTQGLQQVQHILQE